jgi:6-phosphogluconolactonase (cycloisomerase 2 family)
VAKYASGGNDLFGLGIAISPNGKFLYASNGGRASTITVLKINGDGSLNTPVQSVSVPGSQSNMSITADGKTLIATEPNVGKQVSSYTINAATGKLKLASTVSTVSAADGVVIDAHGKFVYVGNGGEGDAADIQVLQIGTGGKLTYVADDAFNGFNLPFIPGGSNCLLLSPNGKLLYFTNQERATVVTLNVNSQTAALILAGTANDGLAFVDEPSQLGRNRAGSLIFTGDFNTGQAPEMGIFTASANGVLTSMGTFPLAQDAAATSIAVATF